MSQEPILWKLQPMKVPAKSPLTESKQVALLKASSKLAALFKPTVKAKNE